MSAEPPIRNPLDFLVLAGHDGGVESDAEGEGGWSRAAQDAAEADSHSPDRLEPDPRPFFDRPIGYVNVRWAFVFAGAIVGGIAGWEAAFHTSSYAWFELALFAGPVVGGLVVFLLTLLAGRFATRSAKPL